MFLECLASFDTRHEKIDWLTVCHRVGLGCKKQWFPNGLRPSTCNLLTWSTVIKACSVVTNMQLQVLIGDSGAGKSCLLLRFADDAFTDSCFSSLVLLSMNSQDA